MTGNRLPTPVHLRKDLARTIRRGHPWVYRDALAGQADIPGGSLVEVRTRDGRPLARGFWDATSPIAVRILESGGPGHRFGDIDRLVSQRLKAALDRRLARLDLAATNAFRWLHGESDLLPGLHADYYAGTVVVRFDGNGAAAFYAPLETRLREAAGSQLPLQRVLGRGASGKAVPEDEVEVVENGLRFVVDVAHGQKGGLFLDQRENRELVATFARDKSVLNLFGYSGGFSIHAAAAGARTTDTVDLAKPALDTARRNFERNGLPLTAAGFHARDAFAFLDSAIRRGQRWDIVVSDPPSFATKEKDVPAALNAYRRLHSLAAMVTGPGGLLCAASCSSHMAEGDFLESIEVGARRAGRRWHLETVRGPAFDHPVLPAFPEGDYLTFAVGRVLGGAGDG